MSLVWEFVASWTPMTDVAVALDVTAVAYPRKRVCCIEVVMLVLAKGHNLGRSIVTAGLHYSAQGWRLEVAVMPKMGQLERFKAR